MVTVALQVPAGLAADGLASRLINKFSSTVSLWQILRTFESGNVDGSGRTWNFTEQSVRNSSGSDDVYAFPRIHAMGRDYTTIEDLQKSLSQLGFNDGSVLLKLDLVPTTKSLQEAKKDMEQYFTNTEESTSTHEPAIPSLTDTTNEEPSTETIPPTSTTTAQPQPTEPTTLSPTIASRPTTVFRPPTSSTPKAALLESRDSDFEPSLDLMKQHQTSIQSATRNKRLLTDAEIATAASASAAKIAAVRSIDIKIVFPDQSSVLAPFTHEDTTKDLYIYVRNLLARPQEPFALNFASAKGLIPLNESDSKKLISDLGFVGRVLVRVSWGAEVGLEARRGPSLKDDVVRIAREIETTTIAGVEDGAQETAHRNTAKDEKEGKKSAAAGGNSSKMPKWLKLPGKK